MDPSTIRVAAVERFGAPITILTRPRPEPGAGEVLLRVAAAAVNPADVGMVEGRYRWVDPVRFPLVPGYDVAGTVAAVGPDVTAVSPGAEVIGFTAHYRTQRGGFAEYVALPAELVAAAPTGMPAVAAATLPLAGLTAIQALAALDLHPGDSLLVNGPSGAIGGFAVELAAAAGVHVVGPVRSGTTQPPGLKAAVHRDGDLRSQVRELYPDGVTAALDVVGGAVARSTLDAVRDGGRYTTVVPAFWRPGGPYDEQRGIVPRVIAVRPDQLQLAELSALAAAGRVTARVAGTFPLERAADALRAVAAGGSGKQVLIP